MNHTREAFDWLLARSRSPIEHFSWARETRNELLKIPQHESSVSLPFGWILPSNFWLLSRRRAIFTYNYGVFTSHLASPRRCLGVNHAMPLNSIERRGDPGINARSSHRPADPTHPRAHRGILLILILKSTSCSYARTIIRIMSHQWIWISRCAFRSSSRSNPRWF